MDYKERRQHEENEQKYNTNTPTGIIKFIVYENKSQFWQRA